MSHQISPGRGKTQEAKSRKNLHPWSAKFKPRIAQERSSKVVSITVKLLEKLTIRVQFLNRHLITYYIKSCKARRNKLKASLIVILGQKSTTSKACKSSTLTEATASQSSDPVESIWHKSPSKPKTSEKSVRKRVCLFPQTSSKSSTCFATWKANGKRWLSQTTCFTIHSLLATIHARRSSSFTLDSKPCANCLRLETHASPWLASIIRPFEKGCQRATSSTENYLQSFLAIVIRESKVS